MHTRAQFSFGALCIMSLCFVYAGQANAQTASQETQCNTVPARSYAVRLSSDLDSTALGALVGLRASGNTDAAPIYNGALWVRVVHAETGEIVDEFMASKGIDRARNEELSLTFDWRVPLHGSGSYILYPTLITSREPFLAAQKSTEAPFTISVVGDSVAAAAHIDSASASVNGETLSEDGIFTAPANSPVTVKVAVRNDSDMPYKGRLFWRTFEGGVSPDNVPSHVRDAEIKLHPHRNVTAQYEVSERTGPVYIQGELSNGQERSFIGIAIIPSTACGMGAFDKKVSSPVFAFMIILAFILGGAWLLVRRMKTN